MSYTQTDTFVDWEELWDDLIEYIKNDECILILGPNISISPQTNNAYLQDFAQVLAKKIRLRSKTPQLFEVVGQYLLKKRHRLKLHKEVRRFYVNEAQEPGFLYTNLAQIPFSLIINTSPDHLLRKAYDNNAIVSFYNFQGEQKKEAPIGKPGMPLIYNLFGSASLPESLILTENDRLDFLMSAISNSPPLPKNLLLELQNPNKILLFVGFDFNEWYLKMLLRILELDDESYVYALEHEKYPVIGMTKVFYQHSFNLSFLPMSTHSFIEALSEEYQKRMSSRVSENSRDSLAVHKLYVAYAENDAYFRNELEKHLRILERSYGLETIHSQKIMAGSDIDRATETQLNSADIILLLLSKDFVASDYLYEVILCRALDRQHNEDTVVLPILLKPLMYEDMEVSSLKILPQKNGTPTPITSPMWASEDEAFTEIVEEIRLVLIE